MGFYESLTLNPLSNPTKARKVLIFSVSIDAHLGKSSAVALRKEGLGLLHTAHEVNTASQAAVVTESQDTDPQDSRDLELMSNNTTSQPGKKAIKYSRAHQLTNHHIYIK